ncbi:MAG: VTT domain-containing protein [Acidobacteriota bacterium]
MVYSTATGIWGALKALFEWLTDFALGLGGPGLFLLAMADSSFLSIPEGNDLLIVVKSSGQGWAMMSYFVLMTVAGSTLGCSLLYSVGRWGGKAVRRRLNAQRVEEIGRIYARRGLWTILVPAVLPPPTPFKIFVLSAGIFRVPFPRFVAAILAGRCIRYFMWGILSLIYGEAVHEFLVNNIRTVGIFALGAVGVLLVIMMYRHFRRKRARLTAGSAAKASTGLALLLALSLMSVQCKVKETRTLAIPSAHLDARDASLEELVELINQRYAGFDSLVLASLEVEFTGEVKEGAYIQEDKYRRANGVLIARRPDSIYFNIKNPIGGASLAAMASQNGLFQIYIPRQKKYFTGRTDVVLREEEKDPRLSVRPHHLLPGLLVEPLPWGKPSFFLTLREDEDAQFKYYVISLVRAEPGQAAGDLIRELWIERSRLELVKQRLYRNGQAETEVRYREAAEIEGKLISTWIDVARPLDGYSMTFELKKEDIRINVSLKEGTFDVPRPPGAELVLVESGPSLPPEQR